MQAIARSAGVAVGTLYNHFPTKADLAAAVVDSFVSDVAEHAEGVNRSVMTGAESPGQAVPEVLRFVLDTWAANHAAKLAAAALGMTRSERSPDENRAADAIAAIVHAAQREGSVRADLTLADLYLLIESAPTSAPKDARDRWLDLVLDGLRSREQ